MLPLWTHFVPWHLLAWSIGVPICILAAAWALAPVAVAEIAKKVPARVWVALAVGVVAVVYHVATIAQISSQVAAAADARWQETLTQAKNKADEKQRTLQAKIDAMAGPSNAEISSQFNDLQKKIDDLKQYDQAHYKPPKPLPADCKLDPATVAAVNKELAK